MRIILAILALVGALLTPDRARWQAPQRAAAMRDNLLVQTNGDRATLGLRPLVFDLHTQSAANERATSQLSASVLTHLDARGDFGFVVNLQQTGIKYGVAGENLARSYSGQNAATFEEAWMASPLHRANIVDPRFTQVALGVANGPRGEVVLVAIFRDSIGDESS
jgi:uncharacterized protein YkwD